MSMDKIKEILGSQEGGEELLKTLGDTLGKLSKGEENQRKSKAEILKVLGVENAQDAISKISEVFNERDNAKTSETALNELQKALKANNTTDILEKVRAFEEQLTKTNEQLGSITNEREAEKAERLKAQKEATEAKLLSEITGNELYKNLKDKKGLVKTAIFHSAKKDDDSGNYLIEGDEGKKLTINEYLQDIIDSQEPMFTQTTKTERPPQGPNTSKVNEAREAMGLPPKE